MTASIDSQNIAENFLVDVIVRTNNSESTLRECLESIFLEIPVRRVILVDAGSTDGTLDIASSFGNVEIFVKPELNLGQVTNYAFSRAQTEWVAVIDSDIVLREGWFDNMRRCIHNNDAVEGCRIDHYNFNVQIDTTKSKYGRFGQTLLKRQPVLNMHLDVPFGEDTITKFNFDKLGLKWDKVPNYLADHYTKLDSTEHLRTGITFRPEPQIIHIPKKVQIEQGHISRGYNTLSKKEVLKRLVLAPMYEAYWAFKKNFWFCLAYFRLM